MVSDQYCTIEWVDWHREQVSVLHHNIPNKPNHCHLISLIFNINKQKKRGKRTTTQAQNTFSFPSPFTQIYCTTAPERLYKAPSFDRFLYEDENRLLKSHRQWKPTIVLSICMKEWPFTLPTFTHSLNSFRYVAISLYTHAQGIYIQRQESPINTYLSTPWPSKNKHEGDLMES